MQSRNGYSNRESHSEVPKNNSRKRSNKQKFDYLHNVDESLLGGPI